jgi:hypothetical protein
LRRFVFLIAVAFLAFPAAMSSAAGSYAFDRGTKAEGETVVAALKASSSPENSMRPIHPGDESAAMAPAKFRALVGRMTDAGTPVGKELMPGWLLWTLVGLGVWVAASVPFGFVAGHLLRRRPAPRLRVVVLAGPASTRDRIRERARTLTRVG